MMMKPGHCQFSPPAARSLLTLAAVVLLAACADKPLKLADSGNSIRAELQAQSQAANRPAAPNSQAAAAAAVPLPAEPPRSEAAGEPRFDLVVNGAPMRDVFLSLVTDTRYSMLVHPDVTGQLSVTLKGVTLREALESIRDVYGYDFRIEGRRITVYPPTMQTRIYTLNYLHNQRKGRSEVRVSSGSAPVQPNSGGTGSTGNTPAAGTAIAQPDSSQISTTTDNDFWAETTAALKALLRNEPGRAVIASPQAGTIAVRAMPDELRHIESFLRSTRASVERQVMLEAKIVEVELREGYQSGIDWSILRNRGAVGQTSVNPSIPTGVNTIINPLVSNSNRLPVLSTSSAGAVLGDLVGVPVAGSGAFGLALSRGGFQALLSFLETHGDVQILSSPRVATLNNQKAVLKVGTDDYFVTGITGTSNNTNNNTTTNNNTQTVPTLTLTPFFSGIALDVTPQIDEANMITLHIHPSVTSVTEKVKQVDLGTVGTFRLPLASSSTNETDTVVKIADGNIVAIGGLMQMESARRGSGLPGSGDNALTSTLFGNRANTARKRELVVLIKPTIIRSAEDWEQLNQQSSAALEAMDAKRRVITVNGK
ncbi:MAG: secretin N-terminal domain-containing protein [Burkholderiaceae bacterium]|nr:secretin N-terminal domain-containing protein [Burkholderiaceae bacterium]